ncbi:exopolysaccharide biosynthesis protein [Loktanella sp. TSTF-M6]|uniref:Exopolysaccharide biosynthesis protein n=1 Tax=Loktanella gaetbuli TaxID=2881335 RepID=A0ABS8BQY4_9RHOB|nr:exopolysaccharide biosynthesis protein [Loktanella gaetbuli]MCB5198135.1 exopolysaccharide biosynthesis protein [Loktanella gaetbuli]
MTKQENAPLLDTLDAVREQTGGNSIALGHVLDRVQERGYGPLIALVSAFCILPTGAIPGVPAVVGIILVLQGVQMLAGKDRPWFPDMIERFQLDCATLKKSVDKARPWAERLEGIIGPRLDPLTNGPIATRAIALCIILSGCLMVPLGFIPFVPALLGLATLLLGVGVTARDGVLVGLGYAASLAGVYTGWVSLPGG